LLQQSASGLGIDQNLQRHRAVSLRQHGFLVLFSERFLRFLTFFIFLERFFYIYALKGHWLSLLYSQLSSPR